MTRPYTRDDVLYHRKCRGDQYVSDYTDGHLTDRSEYVGPVGKIHEFRTMLQYSCQAGSWCVPKFDEKEWTVDHRRSTMPLTARRMCNAILGEPEPTSTFDGSGKEWTYDVVEWATGRGASFNRQTAGDIAAEFGEVKMRFLTHESAPCVISFRKGSLRIGGGAQKWPEAHALLFHAVVQEKRRRELTKVGR